MVTIPHNALMYANYFWVFSFSAVRWTSQVTIITAYNTGFEKQKNPSRQPTETNPKKVAPFSKYACLQNAMIGPRSPEP